MNATATPAAAKPAAKAPSTMVVLSKQHHEILTHIVNGANFPGQMVEVVADLKKALANATILNGKAI